MFVASRVLAISSGVRVFSCVITWVGGASIFNFPLPANPVDTDVTRPFLSTLVGTIVLTVELAPNLSVLCDICISILSILATFILLIPVSLNSL